jgi:hypothetical protein
VVDVVAVGGLVLELVKVRCRDGLSAFQAACLAPMKTTFTLVQTGE